MSTKLLLHVCCGPCAAWPLDFLKADGKFDATGFFYNPNIHPADEFEKRLDGARRIFKNADLPLVVSHDYMQTEWEAFEAANASAGDGRCANVPGAGESGDSPRCEMCYRLRLSRAAQYACDGGFGAFTTTLLISPYQNHDLIASICKEQAAACGVGFYYMDFRPHFRDGQKMARDAGVYRQKYCGCIFSKKTGPPGK